MTPPARDDSAAASQFRRQASGRESGLIGEFVRFLMHNKKWWLAPVLVVLLLLGALVTLAGTGAAPFIYTLF